VTGAHDLAPITTHDLNRFERYSVPDAKFEARLPGLFSAFLEAARRLDLAHVSLMFQPEHNLVLTQKDAGIAFGTWRFFCVKLPLTNGAFGPQ
jgi:hypothetical protein